MAAKPPNIQVPGLNRGAGIPPGYLLGRLPSSGKGKVQLLSVAQLIRFGITSTKNGSGSLGNEAGFTFSVQGVPTANEFVGTGVWSKDITFHNSDPNNIVKAQFAATGAASMRLVDASLTLLGVIDFSGGGTVGTVVWNSDPYLHSAGTPMSLYCPLAADATLGSIVGRVVGYL